MKVQFTPSASRDQVLTSARRFAASSNDSPYGGDRAQADGFVKASAHYPGNDVASMRAAAQQKIAAASDKQSLLRNYAFGSAAVAVGTVVGGLALGVPTGAITLAALPFIAAVPVFGVKGDAPMREAHEARSFLQQLDDWNEIAVRQSTPAA